VADSKSGHHKLFAHRIGSLIWNPFQRNVEKNCRGKVYARSETSSSAQYIMILSPKWIALVALILQNSGLAILMRYTMVSTQVGTDRYLSSTAVLTAEILKLSISVVLCFIVDCNMSYKMFISSLYSEFIGNRSDWIKLMVPSILYTLQNSLQYFSMSRLSAPVFQVLYQLKIVTTAIFSVTLLARRISALQWLSVVMLTGTMY
jgi:solute carrier family 35 (UDP-sugar transporter), member A1/2/3